MGTDTENGDGALCKAYQKQLGGEILESVSRSFYLTLKALPRELQGPISLGYLLARATDTVADSAALPAARRCDLLAEMGEVINGETEGSGLWPALAGEVVPALQDPGECTLLAHFADACAWLGAVPANERQALRTALGHIVRGQSLDTEREPAEEGAVWQLETAAELDEYAYLVAGSVGEFWTDICAIHLPDFPAGGKTIAEMRELGGRFGRGLQLLNILRDLPQDLQNGRCYLPSEEMRAVVADPAEIMSQPSSLLEFARPWMHACEGHLDAGLQYLGGCRGRRLRYATALPLMLGARTLALLREADWQGFASHVKIGRPEVSRIMAKTMFAASSPRRLSSLYEELGS